MCLRYYIKGFFKVILLQKQLILYVSFRLVMLSLKITICADFTYYLVMRKITPDILHFLWKRNLFIVVPFILFIFILYYLYYIFIIFQFSAYMTPTHLLDILCKLLFMYVWNLSHLVSIVWPTYIFMLKYDVKMLLHIPCKLGNILMDITKKITPSIKSAKQI